jgi:SAM-dependent methyltransferase
VSGRIQSELDLAAIHLLGLNLFFVLLRHNEEPRKQRNQRNVKFMTDVERELQKSAFMNGEGDSWFARNAAAVSSASSDVVDEAVSYLGLNPKAILEIGAANGARIERLAQKSGASCAGIDPSAEAIADGLKRYPEIDLRVGTADALPFAAASFDLVIIGFCMYLVDPALHFRSIAEADRVLKDGGHLVVFDFYANHPYYNDYAHLKGLRAHKMEFSKLFLAHPAYSLLHRQLAKKDPDFLQPDRREGADILVKELKSAFPVSPTKR